ncbi:hypothetical protein ACF1GT_00905 [Streptomyces sp. NPDC014636]|uniref:hypothetical protein n=1 Tax=Streptomyces sp. NPDC014636 TaxID=3364876 RepID=UPI003701B997
MTGRGFVIASTTDPRTLLSGHRLAFLDRIGARLLHLVPPGIGTDTEAAVDVDGFYVPHFAEEGQVAVVLRPDHYVFGTATAPDGLGRLVDDLERQLAGPQDPTQEAAGPAPAITTGGAP